MEMKVDELIQLAEQSLDKAMRWNVDSKSDGVIAVSQAASLLAIAKSLAALDVEVP